MATSCVQLCRRCAGHFRSNTWRVSLLVSAHVREAGVRRTAINTNVIAGNRSTFHTRQTRQGCRYYSGYNAGPEQGDRGAEWRSTDALHEHKPALSHIKDALPMTDTDTDTRLGRYKCL